MANEEEYESRGTTKIKCYSVQVRATGEPRRVGGRLVGRTWVTVTPRAPGDEELFVIPNSVHDPLAQYHRLLSYESAVAFAATLAATTPTWTVEFRIVEKQLEYSHTLKAERTTEAFNFERAGRALSTPFGSPSTETPDRDNG